MSDKTFVDTNILVYAYDADAGEKHAAVVLTEDLNHGQNIEGIRIQSPFLNESAEVHR